MAQTPVQRLDELDRAPDACKRYGIKAVVDMHSPSGGRYPNNDLAIFIEAAEWDSAAGYKELEPIAGIPNLIYQVHMYAPGEFTHQGVKGEWIPTTYPGTIGGTVWDKKQIRKALQPVRDFQLAYNVHIVAGEFSAVRWAPGAVTTRREITTANQPLPPALRSPIWLSCAASPNGNHHEYEQLLKGGQYTHANTLCTPTPKPAPLDLLAKPNVMKILLGPTASKHLRASGAECFAFVGKDTCRGDPARWVILFQPVPLAVANAATAVLPGKARAIHSKPATESEFP